MFKYTQLKPAEVIKYNDIVTNKYFIRQNRRWVQFTGESGFMAQNFNVKIYRRKKVKK